ncbi:MAG TPA: OmpA family protein [Terriglobia bacterium]|nr:OmpA family protein [Terriglobia bacterium]
MRTDRFLGLAVFLAIVALFSGSRHCRAQAPDAPGKGPDIQAIEVAEPGGQILSFRHLAGSTVVEMRGTKLEPKASTRLKVESRRGFLELDINRGEIKGLRRARVFGADFHTYVMWAVSVDGEASNLGEITFDETGPVSINVTTPYQTFWLMVTAEPDFAVNDPSPMVVLYSINQDSIQTTNKALPVPGKLLYYTYYHRYDTSPAGAEPAVPNELLQARKAVELASESGILAVATPEGEEPLPDEARTRETFERARSYLQQAEEAFRAGGNTNEAIQFARTAAQIAENARALALGAVGGLYVRKLGRDLERARAEAEACQKELASLREKSEKLQADLAAAEKRLKDAEDKIQALSNELEAARKSLEQAGAENAQLRQDREAICGELRRQLASLGQLSEQGGNMVLTLASDILFDFGSFELRPAARENLAKLAVLRMLLFPNAQVRYEGHTDRPGEEDYNQWLSEQRALNVQRYFLEESMSHETDPARQLTGTLATRLATVERLSRMTFAASRRDLSTRQQLLAELGGTVIGKGEREPVEDVPGQSERNRRVVLLFPPAELGQATSLCQAPPPM